MKKQPEVTRATKNRITDAFFNLYETTPINKIRIADIAAEAHCNRSTFYEYFADIYAVLEYGEERIMEDITRSAETNRSLSQAELLPAIAGVYERNAKDICILLGENGDVQFLQKLKDTLYHVFLDERNVSDNASTQIAYEYTLTGLIMAFRWWYLHQDNCSLPEFLGTMQGLVTKGTLHSLGVTLDLPV